MRILFILVLALFMSMVLEDLNMLLPPAPETDDETLVDELKVGGGGGGGVDTVEIDVELLYELLDPSTEDEDMLEEELLKSFFSFSAFFMSI